MEGFSHVCVVPFLRLEPRNFENVIHLHWHPGSVDRRVKYLVNDRKFTPLSRFVVPTGRNHIPNGVVQPSILTWVCWAGWSLTLPNIPLDHVTAPAIKRQYPREDLMVVR